ncbi:MAG: 6-phosphogluconolactonase [Bacteroidia bacterium]|nr:MAG: 6-phosphogluconolactonase [Bacteroidia bacterium]
MNEIIKIFPTPQALAESLALDIVNLINDTDTSTLPFSIALSGGSTPKLLFSVLGDQFEDFVDWRNVHFFWVDERCVPPDNPESNFGMTNAGFLNRIDIPYANIHRIKGEDNPEKEAERYSGEIKASTIQKNGFPFFNVILLGLGEDGHTASVFPGNEMLFLTDKICDSAVHPSTGQKRITITGKVINNSSEIIFIVTGKNKARIVNNIIGHGNNKKQFPASYVVPVQGKVIWYLDRDAGSLIDHV